MPLKLRNIFCKTNLQYALKNSKTLCVVIFCIAIQVSSCNNLRPAGFTEFKEKVSQPIPSSDTYEISTQKIDWTSPDYINIKTYKRTDPLSVKDDQDIDDVGLPNFVGRYRNGCYLNSALQVIIRTYPGAFANAKWSNSGLNHKNLSAEKKEKNKLAFDRLVERGKIIEKKLTKKGQEAVSGQDMEEFFNAAKEAGMLSAKLGEQEDSSTPFNNLRDLLGLCDSFSCLYLAFCSKGHKVKRDMGQHFGLARPDIKCKVDLANAMAEKFKEHDELFPCSVCKVNYELKSNMKISGAHLPSAFVIEITDFHKSGKVENLLKLEIKNEWTSVNELLPKSNTVYNLKSFIWYSGNGKSGHYKGYVKNEKGKWFCYDDNRVTPVYYEDEVKAAAEQNAKMLVYEKL